MIKNFSSKVDLILTVVLNLLFIICVSVPSLNESSFRIVLGFFLVLFLPGYSLISILFPRIYDLGSVERIILSFGLSIAIVPLLGFGLNYSPFGIRLIPMLIVLSTFTISLSLIALVTRSKFPAEERFRVPFEKLLKVNLGKNTLDKVLSILLIASIITSCAILVYVVLKPKTGERFTEFFILSQNGTAFEYLTDFNVGEYGKVIINVVNHEYKNVNYRLEVTLNGSMIHEEYILVHENEKWENPFTFKATKKGKNQKLEFLLYKNQNREAYRTLHLWVSVT